MGRSGSGCAAGLPAGAAGPAIAQPTCMNVYRLARRVALGSLLIGAPVLAQDIVPAAGEVQPPPPCHFADRPCGNSHLTFDVEFGGGAFVEGHPFAFGAGTGSGTSPGPSWGVRVGWEFMRWLAVDAHYSAGINLINKPYAPTGPVRLITNAATAELRLTLPTPYVQPYILGGIGMYATSVAGTTYEARKGTAFHASSEPGIPLGIGFGIPIAQHVSVGVEAVHHYFLGESFSADEDIEGGDLTVFNAVLRLRF